jgi:magnesium chelatase family protein
MAAVRSATLLGLQGRVLEVTAVTEVGLPQMVMLGMPGSEVTQRDRVRAAIINSGLRWPSAKLTVSVLPREIREHASATDLAIAVAVAAAAGSLPATAAEDVMCYAELGLDGALRPLSGVLPAVTAAAEAGCRAVVVAQQNAAEASLVHGITVIGASRLAQVVGWLCGGPAPEAPAVRLGQAHAPGDIADVRGNPLARAAAEISAAGGHHLSLVGPPASGKSLLASRLAGLLPPLSEADALELTALHSAAGMLGLSGALRREPRFWEADRGSTVADVLGRRRNGALEPGIAALAHNGVLFLGEAPGFSRNVLDALRQPLTHGAVGLMQHASDLEVWFPARFLLVVSASPCPCTAAGVSPESCSCSPLARTRYLRRLSAPLQDRISLRASMSPVERGERGETTEVVAARVLVARERAALRLAGTPWRVNGEVPGEEVLRRFMPAPGGWDPIERAVDLGRVSEFGAADVLRVAWTIADLAGRDRPGRGDCAAALAYRIGEAR